MTGVTSSNSCNNKNINAIMLIAAQPNPDTKNLYKTLAETAMGHMYINTYTNSYANTYMFIYIYTYT